jgi:hypothetical protein
MNQHIHFSTMPFDIQKAGYPVIREVNCCTRCGYEWYVEPWALAGVEAPPFDGCPRPTCDGYDIDGTEVELVPW